MRQRLNVLFVTPWYPSHDNPSTGIFVREHAQAVAQYNNVVILHSAGRVENNESFCPLREETDITLTGGLPTYVMLHRRISIPKTTHLNRFFCLHNAFRTIRKKHFQPDVIHANIHRVALLSVMLGELYRIPVVITEHSSAFPRNLVNARDLFEARMAFRRAHTVMPVSLALQRSIESKGIRANFHVLPNVVDTTLFSPNRSTNSHTMTRRLICVANMPESEVKGYPYLFEALSGLDAEIDWTLDVVGDGPMQAKYKQTAVDLGIADRVQFHGYMTKPAIAQAMQQADIFVIASVWDNFPCVLLEAMAAGLPICATDVGGIPEIVSDESGMLARPAEVDSLRDCLTTMLRKLDSYDSLRIAEMAKKRYSMAAVGRQIDTIYRQALS